MTATLPKTTKMSAETTIARIAEFQANKNDDIRNEIIEGNIGLIQRVANKYTMMEFEDAFQSATIGMIRAIETFDPAEDCEFSTYATKCMKTKLNRESENTAKTVREPNASQWHAREYKRVAEMLRNKLNREPFADEVGEVLINHTKIAEINKKLKAAKKTPITPNEEEALVEQRATLLHELGRQKAMKSQGKWTMDMAEKTAVKICRRTSSIDNMFGHERRFGDHITLSTDENDVGADMDMSEACNALADAMKELNERQADVIRLRFFEEKKLEEIAGTITNLTTGEPLTRERIRQIEGEALLILRTKLRDFGTDARKVIENIAKHVVG